MKKYLIIANLTIGAVLVLLYVAFADPKADSQSNQQSQTSQSSQPSFSGFGK